MTQTDQPVSRDQRRIACLLGAASLALVAGSFLPWAHGLSAQAATGWGLHVVIQPTGMTVEAAAGSGGLNLLAGLGTVAGGILLALVALQAFFRRATLGAKLAATVTATLTAIHVGAVARILTSAAGDGAGPSYGLGVTVAGAAVAFLAVAMLLIQLEPSPGERITLPLDPMVVLGQAIADAQVEAGMAVRGGRPVMTHIAIATTDAQGAGIGYVLGVVPTDLAGAFVAAATSLLRVESGTVICPEDATVD
jgi:hypothetical protein